MKLQEEKEKREKALKLHEAQEKRDLLRGDKMELILELQPFLSRVSEAVEDSKDRDLQNVTEPMPRTIEHTKYVTTKVNSENFHRWMDSCMELFCEKLDLNIPTTVTEVRRCN